MSFYSDNMDPLDMSEINNECSNRNLTSSCLSYLNAKGYSCCLFEFKNMGIKQCIANEYNSKKTMMNTMSSFGTVKVTCYEEYNGISKDDITNEEIGEEIGEETEEEIGEGSSANSAISLRCSFLTLFLVLFLM